MRTTSRLAFSGIAAAVALVAAAAPVLAHECINISKPPPAGVQVVIGPDDQIVWTTRGLAVRLEKGLVTEDGEGFHGLVGIDADGDGVVDFSTFIVGTQGEIPEVAQFSGAPCHGIVNISQLFTPVSQGGCAPDAP